MTYASRCRTAWLRLTLGDPVSEATGQHTTILALINVATTGCHLIGYPDVALSDSRGAPVPFTYQHRRDQTITNRPPGLVELPSHGRAYFALNKYRCDLRDRDLAVVVTITPPGDRAALRLALPPARGVAYCGSADPGSTVDVSPVEPTVDKTAPP